MGADITYIPMAHGFMYLVVIMDWYSRYVLAWRLSNTMDSDFCVEALEEALEKRKPEIFNTDQGVQFTGEAFIEVLQQHGIRISMDGKGSYNDNLFIERLWRTVKYEEVYLKAYRDGREARVGIGKYFRFYNAERPHQALGYRTPAEVYASPVESLNGGMVESLTPATIRTAEPALNIALFCPNNGDHLSSRSGPSHPWIAFNFFLGEKLVVHLNSNKTAFQDKRIPFRACYNPVIISSQGEDWKIARIVQIPWTSLIAA